MEDVAKALENVRAQCPLIHNITNYVTVNDVRQHRAGHGCVAHHGRRYCRGRPTLPRISACAGVEHRHAQHAAPWLPCSTRANAANQAGVPVVLDPVGAGASGAAQRDDGSMLIDEVKLTVLRGNLSEIRFMRRTRSPTPRAWTRRRRTCAMAWRAAWQMAKALAQKLQLHRRHHRRG